MLNRAYSVVTVKSVDNEKRIIEGIATTPSPDRMNDVVVPEGIEIKLPIPFLDGHDSGKPIGLVVAAKITPDGMPVKIQMAGPGIAQFIDEAWALIKNGLIRGLSIGFRSLEESFDKELQGYKYLRTEIMELSAVTIPANAEATITSVKSFAVSEQAASGNKRRDPVRLDTLKTLPGVSGNHIQKGNMKVIAEQIKELEAKRAANVARMEEIRVKSAGEGRTMDEAEGQEFDGLDSENESIVKELTRLKKHEKEMLASATPITEKTAGTTEAASASRGGVVSVRGPDLPKGTAFARYAIALARSQGNLMQAAEIAKQWQDTSPEVGKVLKAAVAAGTTQATGWAAELADYTYMASEFIEFLRPQTIIGKIQGFRRVPFNIKMPLQDAGASTGWVGEGVRKPLTKLNFDTMTLGFTKAAGIVVLTEELVRFSNPSAEAIVRQDLAAAIAQFLDEQFIDSSVAVSGVISPASITNLGPHGAASGADAADLRADFKAILTSMIGANISPSGSYWVMLPTLAVSISLMLNALGQPEFPGINADGGMLMGYPVVTSNSVARAEVSFLKPAEILLADDGGIQLDASREASLVMDNGGSPATTTMVSMWQNNMVALRVEREINWKRRRDEATYYLTGCAYSA
jgi:HK97 family phage major capsid protein/HK97 family phage prohead protease